ncbi:MAG: hypothetical protein A2170_02830 [Deltaproteobacteria bacterium RBG_13_53_10]|nr:MAG: hypothetical protein A2170_02830 [Deltaproteobacteria bacterium RBG_13_53_10]
MLVRKAHGSRAGRGGTKSWESELRNNSNRPGMAAGKDDSSAMIVKNEKLNHKGVFRKHFGPPVRPLQDDHAAAVNRLFNAC